MATSNFWTMEASCVYAVDADDEFIFNDTYENLVCEFEAIAKKNKNIEFYNSGKPFNNRSYPGVCVGELFTTINYIGIEFIVTAKLYMISGYYSGFNLDYEITFCTDNQYSEEEIDNIYDLLWEIEKYPEDFNINKGLIKIHGWRIEKKLEEAEKLLINTVENIYKQFSTPLGIVGQFSNGETIYQKCNVA